MIRRLRAVKTDGAHKTLDTLTVQDLEAYASNPAGFEFDENDPSVGTIARAYRAIKIWDESDRSAENIDFGSLSEPQTGQLLAIANAVTAVAVDARKLATGKVEILRTLRTRSIQNIGKHTKSWVKPSAPGGIDIWSDFLDGLPAKGEKPESGQVPQIDDLLIEQVLKDSAEILGFAAKTTSADDSGVHKQVNTGLAKAAKSLELVVKSLEAHGGSDEALTEAKSLKGKAAKAVVRATTLSGADFQSCDSAQIGLTEQLARIRAKFT